ncbi:MULTISPECIES: Uma2 family endonuclease [Fischerella]|uniref:Uma2 family endonuclease n=1 Tax=Fischerella muscicola CCMEE 5323 TaxID=2019572 RepID=A0A2N6K2Q7_FISMU|nr:MULTISPECIES: Uma2 family endonuclease [Fischerella]MBD2432432.1 Uma2 family endonuclease [Fischerella sp. FACHB-380]PLZ89517.1 Uma2 family endonuclease [Fischerella muscicola CCMEE 5323]
MISTIKRRYTLDEYRALEEKAEGRSEYRDGEIVPMPGGTLKHSRIGRNILTYLTSVLRDTQFEPINNDLRLWIPEYRRGVYPDVMIFDGEPQLNGDRLDEVLNPLVIVEVLSPSTADYDRQNKFRMYRSIPSFSEYLLVEQDEPFVERYSKQTQGWLLSDFNGLERAISLESVGIELPMAEFYRGVVFE